MSLGIASLLPTRFESPKAPPSVVIHHQEAENLLRRSPYLALRNVSCEDQGDRLVLRGHLPCYYLKQLAQPTIAAVAGRRQIVNEIEVIKIGLPDVDVSGDINDGLTISVLERRTVVLTGKQSTAWPLHPDDCASFRSLISTTPAVPTGISFVALQAPSEYAKCMPQP